jgi:ATP-dependent Lon protease
MLEIPSGNLYPVLPLRDIVVFPHMIVPLFVGREKSVRALEDVMKESARWAPCSSSSSCRTAP